MYRIHASLLAFAVMFCAAIWSSPSHASGQATGPNGEYRETHVDLSVAVVGGSVTVGRTWLNGRWYFNPAWADLRFTYDALDDGSVKTIDRAGSVYELSGGVYVFGERLFIRRTDNGWRWNDPIGSWVEYDAAGKVQRYGDRNDVTVHFVRDSEGRIGLIKDHHQVTALTFTYAGGKLVKIADRVGRFVEYDWTGENLTTVTDVLGHDWTYTYDGNGQITGGKDPENRSWSLTYLQSYRAVGAAVPVGVSFSGISGRDFRISRVATLKNEAGHTMRYEYDYDRSKRLWSYIRKFPSGRTEATVYDLKGRVLRQEQGNVVTYLRTRDGDRIEYSKDERGQVTRREFDRSRNPVRITYPDGTSESWTYHPRFAYPTEHVDARGTRTTHRYDEHGNRLETIEAVGEPEARTTTYTWNELGQVTSMTVKGATPDEDATTAYTYDDFGNVATVTDAEQVTTRYTHHPTGLVETTTDGRDKLWTNTYNAAGWLTGNSTPVDPATQYVYDKVGNLRYRTDPAGFTTEFRYDGLDRLVETIDARQARSSMVYNPDGLLVSQTDASGQGATMEYDLRGRLWKTTDRAGNVTETIYGTSEQALQGLVAAIQYPTFREEYKYDGRDRRTQTVRIFDADRRDVTAVGYDANGNTISITDPVGRSTLQQYDRRDRLTQVTDALGGRTGYAYDVHDNLISLTDANLGTHRFVYDRRRRVVAETRPLGETHRYRYDANGNVVEITDARQQRSVSTYDAANRRIRADYFTASAGVPAKTVSFDYDARGLMAAYDDGTTSAAYQYDEVGQLIGENVDYGPFSLGHAYTYKPNGQKATYTAPDGSRVSFDYTAHGQLSRVSLPAEGDIVYSDFQWSRARRVAYPGGNERELNFDPYMRTTSIALRNAADEVLMEHGYEYDVAGNLSAKSTEHGTYRFAYDALDRVVSADYPNGPDNDNVDDSFVPDTFPFNDDKFSYDALGNRLSDEAQSAVSPWRYNANNQLLDSVLAQFSYNPNGSITEKRTPAGAVERSYVYDAEERLVEVRDGSGQAIASYYYDPFGRRLWKTVAAHQPGNDSAGPLTTYTHYNDEGYAAQYTYAGTHPQDGQITPSLDQLYVFAPRSIWSTDPLAVKEHGAEGGWRYPESDLIGTPQAFFDATGAETTQIRANAFGVTREQGERQPLRFAGQIDDPETGYHYNLHRHYVPATGAYAQRDPAGLAFGVNMYGYVNANPLTRFDPYGLCSITGSWMKIPAINITSISDFDFSLIQPYMTWWGFIKMFRVCATGHGFVNVDVKCRKDCECDVDEWEIHARVPFDKRACADFGPNLYAMIAGKFLGPYLGIAINILLMGANALVAGAEVLQEIQQAGNDALARAIGSGPTEMCKKAGGPGGGG